MTTVDRRKITLILDRSAANDIDLRMVLPSQNLPDYIPGV